jgi:hypothetical protein
LRRDGLVWQRRGQGLAVVAEDVALVARHRDDARVAQLAQALL